jgi:hypothetical protein
MNILNWINQGIDNLTNISGPGMEALGFHIFVALLTTMMSARAVSALLRGLIN